MALLVVLMATTLLMALGAGLALLTATEARIAAHFAAGFEALYAADAAIERVVADLAVTADWSAVTSGSARSSFVDGQPPGTRRLADGSEIDLAAAGTAGAGGPWRLYAHAPISQMLPAGRIRSRVYVVIWVADAAGATGGDVLVLRARAYGVHGARRTVEASVARGDTRPRLLSWREL